MKNTNVIVAAITSAVSGAIIGILFAPDKGSNIRRKISKESDEYLKSLRKDLDEIRHNLNKKVKETKEEVSETGQQLKEKGEDLAEEAKDKAEDYEQWTEDELTKLAKELNIDGYTNMNKSELLKALKNE